MDRKLGLLSIEEKRLSQALKHLSPMGKIRDKLLRMDQYQDSLNMLMEKRLKAARHELEVDIERLKGLSPLERLKTGYSYVADEKGKNVRSTSDVKIGDELSVYVSDGLIKTSVTGTGTVGFLSGRED